MEATLAKWMTTREEQTNKEQSPEEARGEKGEDMMMMIESVLAGRRCSKGEDITGKRKRKEEEKPD